MGEGKRTYDRPAFGGRGGGAPPGKRENLKKFRPPHESFKIQKRWGGGTKREHHCNSNKREKCRGTKKRACKGSATVTLEMLTYMTPLNGTGNGESQVEH